MPKAHTRRIHGRECVVACTTLTMKSESSELSKSILEVVSTDHTPFEALVGDLMPKERFDHDEFCLDLVEGQLLSLLSDGLIQAHLLHAEPPFVTQVLPSRSTLRRFWFLITPKGEQHLSALLNDGCDGHRSDRGVLASGSHRCSPAVHIEIDRGGDGRFPPSERPGKSASSISRHQVPKSFIDAQIAQIFRTSVIAAFARRDSTESIASPGSREERTLDRRCGRFKRHPRCQ